MVLEGKHRSDTWYFVHKYAVGFEVERVEVWVSGFSKEKILVTGIEGSKGVVTSWREKAREGNSSGRSNYADERTREVGEEEVLVDERGSNVEEGKVVLDLLCISLAGED